MDGKRIRCGDRLKTPIWHNTAGTGFRRGAIPAAEGDAAAMGKENAITVICGITRDLGQHRKDAS